MRRDPRRTKGPGARERRSLEVAAREPDQQRRPGRPGGDVQADDLLLRDAGERPERRVLRLRGEQLRLGHERLLGERRGGVEPFAVEQRPRAHALDLPRQRTPLEGQLLREREALHVVHEPIVTSNVICLRGAGSSSSLCARAHRGRTRRRTRWRIARRNRPEPRRRRAWRPPEPRNRQRWLRRTELRPLPPLPDGRPAQAIDGDETISARATQSLSQFNLDFGGKSVGAVSVNGQPAAFKRTEEELVDHAVEPDCRRPTFTVRIVNFSAVPMKITATSIRPRSSLPRRLGDRTAAVRRAPDLPVQ